MRRSLFLPLLALATLAAALGFLAVAEPAEPARGRRMAVTVDDLPAAPPRVHSTAEQAEITEALLATLRRHRVPAIGFVNEGTLEVEGRVDSGHRALLERWLDAGFELEFSDLRRYPPGTHPGILLIRARNKGRSARSGPAPGLCGSPPPGARGGRPQRPPLPLLTEIEEILKAFLRGEPLDKEIRIEVPFPAFVGAE